MSSFKLDATEYERLASLIKEQGKEAVNTINSVLWDDGGLLISEAIMDLLPVSGRNWAGKAPAAKSANPFVQKNERLSVTIRTNGVYNYLYFPDDGSTTLRHAGEQEFMYRGAEKEQQRIIDLCVAELLHDF